MKDPILRKKDWTIFLRLLKRSCQYKRSFTLANENIKGFDSSSVIKANSSRIKMHQLSRIHLGLICIVKKRKIHFRIPWDLRIQTWIFLKKCTLSILCNSTSLKLPRTHHHFQIVDSQREDKYERNRSRGIVIYVIKSFSFNFLAKASE